MSKTLKAILISLLVLIVATLGTYWYFNHDYVKIAFGSELVWVNRLGRIKYTNDPLFDIDNLKKFRTYDASTGISVNSWRHDPEKTEISYFTKQELEEFKGLVKKLGPSYVNYGVSYAYVSMYVHAKVGFKNYETAYWFADLKNDYSHAEVNEIVPVVEFLAEKLGLDYYTPKYQIEKLQKEHEEELKERRRQAGTYHLFYGEDE